MKVIIFHWDTSNKAISSTDFEAADIVFFTNVYDRTQIKSIRSQTNRLSFCSDISHNNIFFLSAFPIVQTRQYNSFVFATLCHPITFSSIHILYSDSVQQKEVDLCVTKEKNKGVIKDIDSLFLFEKQLSENKHISSDWFYVPQSNLFVYNPFIEQYNIQVDKIQIRQDWVDCYSIDRKEVIQQQAQPFGILQPNLFGASKVKIDLSSFSSPLILSGYGEPSNTNKHGTLSNLYVRCIRWNSMIFVLLDLIYVTTYLRQSVLKKLKERKILRDQDQCILTATHTHSGPGGLDDYFFYNIECGGQNKKLIDLLTETVVQAINSTYDSKTYMNNIRVEWSQKLILSGVDKYVFNRSPGAYRSNQDTPNELLDHQMIDPVMKSFFFTDTQSNQLFAVLNFFGCHNTCINNKVCKICADHKGYAADYFENVLHPGCVALFAQDASGDLSPNEFEHQGDDEKACEQKAQRLGHFQALSCQNIWQTLTLSNSVNKTIDMKNYEQIYSFANNTFLSPLDQTTKTTGDATLGLAFTLGTKDGPGLKKDFWFSLLQSSLSLVPGTQECQKPKIEWINTTGKKILFQPSDNFLVQKAVNAFSPVPVSFQDDQILYPDKSTWVNTQLPLACSIFFDQVILLYLPFEITLTAARRLTQSIQSLVGSTYIIQIVPYSNGYAGYITTEEEFLCQEYEGGHTLFGKHSLDYLLYCFVNLLKLKQKEKEQTRQVQSVTQIIELPSDCCCY